MSILREKIILYIKFNYYKKVLEQERKTFSKSRMLLQKEQRSRDKQYEEIYIPPYNHTHRFHPLPLATPASYSPHPLATPIQFTHSPQLSSILLTCAKFKVWMTIVESGWNVWVWLVGVVSRRWVWLVGEGGIYGCGCKEVYRFPHTTYPYSSCICSFFSAASLLFVHF